MSYDLEGRVAIVTGGARGQGRAQAELLARCGARVIVGDVLDEVGEATAAAMQEQGLKGYYRHLDVADPDDWDGIIADALDRWGRLDILVNNAGIINRTLIGDTSLEDWDRLLRINLTGCFIGIKKCVVPMLEAKRGAIVNIASNAGLSAHYDPAYSASKWGLRGLTKTAAMEYVKHGIRVNAVCPGMIETDLNRNSPNLRPMIEQTPMERGGQLDEVAQLVAFLVSDASSYITAEDFVIDGGFIAGGSYRQAAKASGNII